MILHFSGLMIVLVIYVFLPVSFFLISSAIVEGASLHEVLMASVPKKNLINLSPYGYKFAISGVSF